MKAMEAIHSEQKYHYLHKPKNKPSVVFIKVSFRFIICVRTTSFRDLEQLEEGGSQKIQTKARDAVISPAKGIHYILTSGNSVALGAFLQFLGAVI